MDTEVIEGLPSDVDNIPNLANKEITKVMVNGQIVIIKGDRQYNILGDEIK